MPAVTSRPTTRGNKVDAWQLAIESGLRTGVASGAETLLEYTDFLIAAEEDPWGAAWRPRSEVTIRIEAEQSSTSERDFTRQGMLQVLEHERRIKADVVVRRRDRQIAAVLNFGNPNNRIFGKALAPIPPRPFLAIGPDGSLSLPEPIRAQVISIIQEALRQTLSRVSPSDGASV